MSRSKDKKAIPKKKGPKNPLEQPQSKKDLRHQLYDMLTNDLATSKINLNMPLPVAAFVTHQPNSQSNSVRPRSEFEPDQPKSGYPVPEAHLLATTVHGAVVSFKLTLTPDLELASSIMASKQIDISTFKATSIDCSEEHVALSSYEEGSKRCRIDILRRADLFHICNMMFYSKLPIHFTCLFNNCGVRYVMTIDSSMNYKVFALANDALHFAFPNEDVLLEECDA